MGNPISSFKIKLIGDNHITNKNGIGILTFNTGIKFEGTGTITIDAEIPILSYDAEKDVDKEALINGDYSELINNSSNIDEINSDIEEELEENISDNESEIVDVSTEDISDNKKINYYQIVSIILGVACILLIIKNIKIKDKKSR